MDLTVTLQGEVSMSKKLVVAALGAMVAVGIGAQAVGQGTSTTKNKTATAHKKLHRGYEKCYGIAKAGMNDCGSSTEACAGQSKEDGAKNAWLGLPKGTCNKIVGGSTTEGSA
jgi:uncharacterized membrane protein